jgi:hypothetical protein
MPMQQETGLHFIGFPLDCCNCSIVGVKRNKIVLDEDLTNGHIRCQTLKMTRDGLVECCWSCGYESFSLCCLLQVN